MVTGETWRLGRRPALDGVRGVAVLLVLAHHSLARWDAATGTVGVTMFFALSGFLITALLLEERDRSGAIELRAFYLRRTRRLVPALVAFLAVVLPVAALVAPWLVDWSTIPAALLYVVNWLPAATGVDLLGLSHLWSLAVEEQFYLVWPVVVLLCARRFGDRGVAIAASVGIGSSVALRFALWHGGAGIDRIYYATDTRLDGLLVGSLFAVLVRAGWRVRPFAAAVGLAGLLLLAASNGRDLLAPTVAPWLTALVLAAVASGHATSLGASWLAYIGRRSYALYLWHFPLLWWSYQLPADLRPAAVVLILAATFGLAELSWRLVERPKRQRRLVPDVEVQAVHPMTAVAA